MDFSLALYTYIMKYHPRKIRGYMAFLLILSYVP